METFLIKGAQLLLSLSILVILHELGHFIPAKIFKTRVEKFFLFFDVKFALFKKKIGETVYGIGWLPLGGYVKIAGMIDESMDKEQMAQPPQPWEFRSKPAWQRLIIMIGGVTVNLLLGFFIYTMIFWTWGSQEFQAKDVPQGYAVSQTLKQFGVQDGDIPLKINGKEISDTYKAVNRSLLLHKVNSLTVRHQNGEVQTLSLPDSIGKMLFENGDLLALTPFRKSIVDSVLSGSAAAQAGILKGDKITQINGEKIAHFNQMGEVLAKIPEGEKVSVVVERNKELLTLQATPKNHRLGVTGIHFDKINPTQVKYSFIQAIGKGFSHAYETLSDYISQFKYVFTKKGASQLGGFGSMAKIFEPEWNWMRFWESTALISIILAFMNILPIPALDGGHVVFLLYEMITGRKPNEKVLEYAQIIGISLLFALLLYANGNDLYRWISGK